MSRPGVFRRPSWSIGLYSGPSPLALAPAAGVTNPVLTAADVTDRPAAFVADPFMIARDHVWHLFFEVMDRETGRGAIGWATGTPGARWQYQRIVLDEPWHLSYPYVFACGDEVFMTPEGLGGGCVRLYRAREFPLRWERAEVLIPERLGDPSPVFHEGRWWMFACGTPEAHDSLRLWSAVALTGPWLEHPQSPLVTDDRTRARPAGRPLVHDGALWRFAQDCVPFYGRRVQAFRVPDVGATHYREDARARTALTPTRTGWNARRMHHLDAHALPDGTWIACVDGCPT